MATKTPTWVPKRYRDHWQRPWTTRARRSPGFRALLARHKHLSPHYTYGEAASKDGVPIPARMRARARNHAFKMEVLRHELGDGPLPVLSWYRSPARNRAVGGAAESRHMKADACDIDVAVVRKHPRFDQIADRIFANSGFGQYPGGNRHVDSRPGRARWTSFRPGR